MSRKIKNVNISKIIQQSENALWSFIDESKFHKQSQQTTII